MLNQRSNQLNKQLRLVAEEGLIDTAELDQAYQLTEKTPMPQQWLWFLNTALLSLGALFIVSGIFFFFAWNWTKIGRLPKFAIIEVAIVATAIFAFWKGLDSLPAKISLAASSALIGVLFAVMGQEYQSPADSWILFFLWALFAAGWVAIGRFAPLWLGWFALINLTFYLWLDQTGGFSDLSRDSKFVFNLNLITVLNSLILVLWELAMPRLEKWAAGRWLPRTMAVFTVGSGTLSMLWLIFDWQSLVTDSLSTSIFTLLLYVLIVGLVIAIYGYSQQDLFMVTAVLFSLIVVITSKAGDIIFSWANSELAALPLGLIVIGLGWLSFQFLRTLQKQQALPEAQL
ncbi:MAG: putative membrane protein [Cellvibrionaceae bacterium]|jgi:uncharacterized membrane protein